MLRILVCASVSVWLVAASAGRAADEPPGKALKPFLAAHCIKCHGPDKQAGDVRLDDLPDDAAKAPERWLAVRDQLRDGLMPPPKEPRPDSAKVRSAVNLLTAIAGAKPPRFPNQGNQVPHELLFGRPADAAAPSPARLWRLSPDDYLGFLNGVMGNKALNNGRPAAGIMQPFVLVPERGIRDFAGLYSIDQPTTDVLLRNAQAVVNYQLGLGAKNAGPNGVAEMAALLKTDKPSKAQLEAALQKEFQMALGRPATADEFGRYLALYEKCAKDGDTAGAARTMLQAVLLKSDAVFRSELGTGPDGNGRSMLAPLELAQALSFALGHRRDAALVEAAQKGALATKEQVAGQVRRMFTDPKADTSRLLGFFREYFEYHKAEDVFKDKPRDFEHSPRTLVADTDRLVLHVLSEDKDVFRRMLTTSETFANYSVKKDKNNVEGPQPAVPPKKADKNSPAPMNVEGVYGFPEWPAKQPADLPKDTRIGILMQPSWLVAWSTNFDNDPVRRGRWVRERLLGGTVPELPIGVAAQVPDDPHRTFRDRLTVTRAESCWKCHQKMDELGLPFEQFDHYGRFRTVEEIPDPKAPPRKNAMGRVIGPAIVTHPLNAAGTVTDSGDPKLDGPVKDPREMIRKIADSDLARQVFVRHAFRYFMGRNERLSDAKTLQEADQAYVESGGSFKALVVSLLTSDPFLYRAKPAAQGDSK